MKTAAWTPPGATAGEEICFPYTPRVVVGGLGGTSDPYGGVAVGCTPNGNDVFACDSDPLNAVAVSVGVAETAMLVRIDPDTQAAHDQETVAIAREAEYLPTWNCAHIANATMRRAIDDVCSSDGYLPTVLCTPEELFEE